MKDHEIRELVNQLRDVAIKYHGAGQLREQIARVVRAHMLQAGNSPVIPDEWRSVLSEMVDAMRRYEMDVAGECDAPLRHRRMMHRAEQLLGIGVQEESHD